MGEATAQRNLRKKRSGRVVSNAMDKTIVVRVEGKRRHPLLGKVVKYHKKFFAHDEKEEARVGDYVRIEETRPVSKKKNWRLAEVIEKVILPEDSE